jgi:glutamate/tyrosine decarboxylase-like PLP-dependent enzyme
VFTQQAGDKVFFIPILRCSQIGDPPQGHSRRCTQVGRTFLQRLPRWNGESFGGLPSSLGYRSEAGGCLLSGGSAGNLVGLDVARKQKAPFDADSVGMRGGPLLTVYASREVHASVDKAMVILGMGRDHLRKIAVRDDFTIDLEALKKQVSEDRNGGYHPICVVGVAGTTNTGAVDPLDRLAEFCQAQGLWFHLDAAYGGPAASTKVAGKLFQRLELADSVVVNPHRWLYVPAEAACILVREPAALRHTFQVAADYLKEGNDIGTDAPLDFKDYGPQLHRNFRALKVWMTFKAYGAEKLRAAIESNIEIMQYLANRIDESPDFVRLAPAPLSVVCFQYRTLDDCRHTDQRYLNDLNSHMLDVLEKDGRIFLSGTTINGQRALPLRGSWNSSPAPSPSGTRSGSKKALRKSSPMSRRISRLQTVDATPSNALIRPCFPRLNPFVCCTRSNPSQGSVPAHLIRVSDLVFVFNASRARPKCCVDPLRPPNLSL